MRKINMFSSVIILIGAILMAACGQAVAPTAIANVPAVATTAPAAPVAQASPNPTVANPPAVATGNCSILSKEDVGTVLGESVVEVRDEAKSTVCAYQTKNLILELNFLNTGGMTAEQYMQNIRSINENGISVTGLGDEAFNKAAKFGLDIELEDQILGLVHTQRAVFCWIPDIYNSICQDLAYLVL
jgi:hypothetical protein